MTIPTCLMGQKCALIETESETPISQYWLTCVILIILSTTVLSDKHVRFSPPQSGGDPDDVERTVGERAADYSLDPSEFNYLPSSG